MSLTPKKKAVLDYIASYQQENKGLSPTLEEIAAHLGIRSPSTAHDHIERLAPDPHRKQHPDPIAPIGNHDRRSAFLRLRLRA